MSESTPPLGLEAWPERLAELFPADLADAAGPAERAVLLELARVAAHRGQRIAAPITTYLAGVAFAGLAPAERLARLRAHTIRSHATSHGVVNQSARTDLLDLRQRGLLERRTSGRVFRFYPAPDLPARLEAVSG